MATPVFLTIDTEFAWRWHVRGLGVDAIVARSIEPAGVGLAFQLDMLRRYDLRACFFVDPMPALVYGVAPFRAVVAAILAAGQEVQLHLHANWAGAALGDGGAAHGAFELIDLPGAEQRALIATARDLLVDAGAPRPVAFRAGSYAADDRTLDALAALGFRYDSSHNGAQPRVSRIALPPRRIAPVAHRGVVEVPVTVIEQEPGKLRTAQICALSATEMRAALDHAARHRHAAVTVVSHAFELATRDATAVNRVHRARFAALCRHLAAHRKTLPTTRFDAAPPVRLDADDAPLPPARWRTRARQAEQLWSNLVAERGW